MVIQACRLGRNVPLNEVSLENTTAKLAVFVANDKMKVRVL